MEFKIPSTMQKQNCGQIRWHRKEPRKSLGNQRHPKSVQGNQEETLANFICQGDGRDAVSSCCSSCCSLLLALFFFFFFLLFSSSASSSFLVLPFFPLFLVLPLVLP